MGRGSSVPWLLPLLTLGCAEGREELPLLSFIQVGTELDELRSKIKYQEGELETAGGTEEGLPCSLCAPHLCPTPSAPWSQDHPRGEPACPAANLSIYFCLKSSQNEVWSSSLATARSWLVCSLGFTCSKASICLVPWLAAATRQGWHQGRDGGAQHRGAGALWGEN